MSDESVVLPDGEWVISRNQRGLSVGVHLHTLGEVPIAHIAGGWEQAQEFHLAKAIQALPLLVDAMRELPPHLTRRPPADAECHSGITTQTYCPECKRYVNLIHARSALGFEPVRPQRR